MQETCVYTYHLNSLGRPIDATNIPGNVGGLLVSRSTGNLPAVKVVDLPRVLDLQTF